MISHDSFNYYNYPAYLYGTQMYMITKYYAKYILDSYYSTFSKYRHKYFIFDKLLLHDGNRALIYPMLAIENEEQKDKYHQLCHKTHNNEVYI